MRLKLTSAKRMGSPLKIRLIDSIIDRIANRVGDRIAQLVDQHALSLAKTQDIVAAPAASLEGAQHHRDPILQQPDGVEWMSYAKVIGELPPPQHPPTAPRRQSQLCKQADFSLDSYRYWSSAVGLVPTLHRKHWEFFYLCQALYERGLLNQGRKGLGFGVGREPLPALFASLGCNVVATDQAPDEAIRGGWQDTRQHADSIAALERPEICATTTFRERVSFEVVDMNNIPAHLARRFDFCWSVCCLEHLGSLEHGLRFIANSLDTLKIGGLAVHTTEFNLSSNAATLESPGLSIYRRCDIEALFKKLEQAGHQVEPLDLTTGTTLVDGYIDSPPYHNEPHLRLQIAGYNCTSIGLIITRGN
jgi:SAM-dependent methyltransferase